MGGRAQQTTPPKAGGTKGNFISSPQTTRDPNSDKIKKPFANKRAYQLPWEDKPKF